MQLEGVKVSDGKVAVLFKSDIIRASILYSVSYSRELPNEAYEPFETAVSELDALLKNAEKYEGSLGIAEASAENAKKSEINAKKSEELAVSSASTAEEYGSKAIESAETAINKAEVASIAAQTAEACKAAAEESVRPCCSRPSLSCRTMALPGRAPSTNR